MTISITNNRTSFISKLIQQCGYSTYLELGIDNGKNISYIAKFTGIKCFGVDMASPQNTEGFTFFNSTTDAFFKNNSKKFDVVFIDACHRIDYVKRDFENSLNTLNKNGIIILHDVDPICMNFIDNEGFNYSSSAYKIVDYVYANYKELNIIVLPIDETGIAIVNRKYDRRIYEYIGGTNV